MAGRRSTFAKGESPVRSVVRCAHDGCDYPSICNMSLKTGKANLCRLHYDQHFQIQADRNNYERGLKTVDDMIAYCRRTLAHPRSPGNWWANEIMEKQAHGEHVSILALEMAKAALAPKLDRIVGEDDEPMETD